MWSNAPQGAARSGDTARPQARRSWDAEPPAGHEGLPHILLPRPSTRNEAETRSGLHTGDRTPQPGQRESPGRAQGEKRRLGVLEEGAPAYAAQSGN